MDDLLEEPETPFEEDAVEEEEVEATPEPIIDEPVIENKLTIWQREHDAELQEKEQAEMTAHEAKIEEAKADLAQFYEERSKRVQNKRQANIDAETVLLDSQGTTQSERVWEQAVGMVSLADTQEGTDKTRMRQLLLAAKQEEIKT